MENIIFNTVIVGFIVVFILAFIIIIINAFTSIHQNKKDKNAPIDTIKAKVISKRTDVSGKHYDDYSRINTSYYVTFELYNKDRIEFLVDDEDYGILIEGDEGMLTYQGTRFKSFDRLK